MEQTSTPLFFNFRTWLKAFVLTVILLSPVVVQAQTQIFKETMGSDNNTGPVADYEAAGLFDNDNLTMSGSAAAAVKNATPSGGYTDASEYSYIELGQNVFFDISDISTNGYSAISLSLGALKSSNATLSISYSVDDKVTWKPLTLSSSIATTWTFITNITGLPESNDLSIRFMNTGRGAVKLDDIQLFGQGINPSITSFTPIKGASGTEVVITGENLGSTHEVYFPDGEWVSAFPDASDVTSTSVKFMVPDGAGTSVLELYDIDGNFLTVSSEPFTVIAPVITNIAPKEGFVVDTIKIYGANLNTATSVRFGAGGNATPTFLSDIEIHVIVPATAKSGALQVTTVDGTATSDINNRFTVLVPTVTGFTPSQGSPKPAGIQGDEITITGNYLSTASSVVFGGAGSAVPHFTSETSIRVYVPDNAETGTLKVVTAKGTVTSSASFTVLKPKITSLSKNNGKVGEMIFITGSRLNVAPFSVKFGGGAMATVTSNSLTQLAVTVPSGAESGVVTVTTAEGTAVTASSFSVVKPTFIVQNTPLDPFTTKVGVPSEPQFYAIAGSNLEGSLNIAVPSQFEVSGDEGTTWTTGGVSYIPDASGTVTQKNILVRYNPSAKGSHSGNITNISASLTELIAVQGATLDPAITVTGTLTPFTAKTNTASASQSYQVSGENLEGNLTVTAPTAFQVSLDGATYSSSATITPANGAVTATTIYVRYLPGSSGSHSGEISMSSTNAATQTITASGYTVDPTITVTGAFTEFSTDVNTPSASQTYTVSGTNLEGGITIAGPASLEFKVSLDNTNFFRTLSVPLAAGATSIGETTIYVRYEPAEAGPHSATITQSSLNATAVTLAANGSTSKSSLPVELISFKAEKKADEVTLLWATASEKDNSHFEVEMAANSEAGFTRIGKVRSKAGTSSVTTNYLLRYNLTSAGTHYFRLKQVDLDGTATYSKVVAVEIEATLAGAKVIVAPNPLNYNSKVVIAADADGKASLVLQSMAGQQLYQKTVAVSKGQNEVQLPLYDQLKNGLYILTVELQGQRHQVKVVKQ